MSKRTTCKRCSGKGYIYVTFSEGNTGTATSYICPDCNGSGNIVVPMTNADRIRAMSDEELAAWMAECNAYREYANASQWLPWLQQPEEEQI